MTQEEIIEGNRLIAKFKGWFEEENGLEGTWYEIQGHAKYVAFSTYKETYRDLPFHRSWDWLMPVWMKIIQMEEKDFNLDEGTIGKKTTFLRCYIYTDKGWNEKTCYHDCIDYKNGEEIESKDIQECLYKTVVDFIKWYNLKTK
jgi:hypothetical protein